MKKKKNEKKRKQNRRTMPHQYTNSAAQLTSLGFLVDQTMNILTQGVAGRVVINQKISLGTFFFM